MYSQFNQTKKTKMNSALSKIVGASMLVAASLSVAQAAPLNIQPVIGSASGFHVTSSLIKGEKEMILVDGQFLQSDAHRLVAQMLETGLSLKSIVITHAHPDHYFGLDVVLKSFPNTPIYAAPEVVTEMAVMSPKKMKQWKPVFGNNLTNNPVTATPLASNTLMLEGESIELIKIGQADTHDTTAFYVPSAKTIIAGDLAYKDIHPWTAETNNASRKDWIKNLEKLNKLGASKIIAGHMLENSDTDISAVLNFNKTYLTQFNRAVSDTSSVEEMRTQVFSNYPDLQLPIIAEIGVKVAKSN